MQFGGKPANQIPELGSSKHPNFYSETVNGWEEVGTRAKRDEQTTVFAL